MLLEAGGRLNRPIVHGEPDVMAHVFNPITQGVEEGRSRVQGQPELHSGILPQKQTSQQGTCWCWQEGTQEGGALKKGIPAGRC